MRRLETGQQKESMVSDLPSNLTHVFVVSACKAYLNQLCKVDEAVEQNQGREAQTVIHNCRMY